MPKIKPSMDRAVLNLIEVLEREGRLKLSSRRAKRTSTKKPTYQPDELLRDRHAAAVLNVSPKTLANWRVSGTGPRFIKSGRLVTYRYADLQAFIAAGSRSSTSENGER